jgi:hypothetical protein
MLATLRALDALIFELLDMVNGWLKSCPFQHIPTEAQQKRLRLQKQLYAAHRMVKTAMHLVSYQDHTSLLLLSELWYGVEQELIKGREQDSTFQAFTLYLGPDPKKEEDKGVPYRIEYFTSLKSIGV